MTNTYSSIKFHRKTSTDRYGCQQGSVHSKIVTVLMVSRRLMTKLYAHSCKSCDHLYMIAPLLPLSKDYNNSLIEIFMTNYVNIFRIVQLLIIKTTARSRYTLEIDITFHECANVCISIHIIITISLNYEDVIRQKCISLNEWTVLLLQLWSLRIHLQCWRIWNLFFAILHAMVNFHNQAILTFL